MAASEEQLHPPTLLPAEAAPGALAPALGAEAPPGTSAATASAAPAAAGETKPIKAYERTWSLDELRASARTWTAACDYGLLTYLRSFSSQLLDRTRAVQSQVDGLVYQARAADANVHSTLNQFLMLSNSQFIENVR